MFDLRRGEEEPDIAIPDMPYYDSNRSELYQAYVSAYSIDGFFSSLVETIGVNGWANNTMIPEEVPVGLTTTTLNVLLPGISHHYGADLPVDIFFNVTSLGNFTVSEANEQMSGIADLTLDFYVEKSDGTVELADELLLSSTEFEFTALVNNMNVALNITKVKIDGVAVSYHSFGHPSAVAIKLELNNALNIGLPLLNTLLTQH